MSLLLWCNANICPIMCIWLLRCHAMMPCGFTAPRRDIMAWRHVTSRCDVTSHHHIRWCNMSLHLICEGHQGQNWVNDDDECDDLAHWPMTLTFELIRDIIKVNIPTKFRIRMSNCSAVRVLTDRRTDRQTHWRDRFYTLDRWRGRE